MMRAASSETFFTILQNGAHKSVRYRKIGHGKIVLLLLPGALGTIETDFTAQIDSLDPEHFTLVGWDPPGYGRHGDAKRYWEVDMLDRDADHAVDLMKHLNIKKFSVLGFSDGANTAFLMAAKYPDLVEKVIAVGGNAYADAQDIEIYEATRDVDSWEPALKDPMFAVYGREKYIHLWNNWCDVMKKIYETRGGNICKDALEHVKARTLIVNGRNDDAVPIHHPIYLAEHIKGTELWIAANSGHDIHLSRSKCFNAILTKFLQAD